MFFLLLFNWSYTSGKKFFDMMCCALCQEKSLIPNQSYVFIKLNYWTWLGTLLKQFKALSIWFFEFVFLTGDLGLSPWQVRGLVGGLKGVGFGLGWPVLEASPKPRSLVKMTNFWRKRKNAARPIFPRKSENICHTANFVQKWKKNCCMTKILQKKSEI